MDSAIARVPAHLTMFALLFAAAILLIAARKRSLDMHYYRWLVAALMCGGIYFYLLAISIKTTALIDRPNLIWCLASLEWLTIITGGRWLVGTMRRSFHVERRRTPNGITAAGTD